MERCIFCHWNRKTAYPSIRFFAVPKEPGLKRVQWLYAIGKRDFTPRDRVCSVHFRNGKPSSDPSHEDFTPHLYLNKDPPPEVIAYLERLAEGGGEAAHLEHPDHPTFKASVSTSNPSLVEYNKVTRPSILQRKKVRKPGEDDHQPGQQEGDKPSVGDVMTANVKLDEPSSPQQHGEQFEEERPSEEGQRRRQVLPPQSSSRVNHYCDLEMEGGETRRMRLLKLEREWVAATGLRPGQKVTLKIKRRHPVDLDIPKENKIRIRMEDEHGNVIEERLVTQEEAERMQAEAEERHREMLAASYEEELPPEAIILQEEDVNQVQGTQIRYE